MSLKAQLDYPKKPTVPLVASVFRLLRTKVALWEPLHTWTPLEDTLSAVCSTYSTDETTKNTLLIQLLNLVFCDIQHNQGLRM